MAGMKSIFLFLAPFVASRWINGKWLVRLSLPGYLCRRGVWQKKENDEVRTVFRNPRRVDGRGGGRFPAGGSVFRPLSPGEVSQRTDLLARTVAQLGEYFSGQRRQFDLPLGGQGSAFSRAVWQALLGIPYGQTCTYGQLAAQVGRSRASRAVGRACHLNPLVLVVPCHRVVGADGSLTGYAGGMAAKAFLLALEARSSGR